MNDTDNIVSKMNSLLSGAMGPNNEAYLRVADYRNKYYNLGEEASPDLNMGGGRRLITSRALVKDVMRVVEGSIPSLVQPFVDKDIAVVESMGSGDVEADHHMGIDVSDFINDSWNKKNNPLETVETIARNMQVDGTAWTRVGWDSAGHPTVDVVPFESVIPDPAAYTIDDMRFMIYRRKISISDILSNPKWFGKHTLDSLSPLSQTKNTEHEPDDYPRAGSDDGFDMGQRASEMIEVFEFYGQYDIDEDGISEPVVVIWSDNLFLNAFDNPYEGFWNPFDAGVYLRRAYTPYGSGVAELIGEHQQTRQDMLRGILDNMNKSTNGMTFVKKGAFDTKSYKRYQNGASVIEVNHNSQEPLGNAFWDGGFNQIPPEVYKLMESYEIEEENLTGITKYSVGSDSRALNQTATGVSIISSMSQRRLVFITQHIAGLLKRVFTKWMMMHGSINLGVDLSHNSGTNLYVKAGTAGLAAKKGQDITNMLQALAPHAQNIDPMIITDLVADLAKTFDLDETAARIRKGADEQRKMSKDPEMAARQAAEESMVQEIQMRGEAAKVSKDESIAAKNNAMAAKAQVDAAAAMYQNSGGE